MATKSEKLDVYEIITKQVCELLEKGTIPWKKPWKGQQAHPMNAASGTHYRGVNPMLLEISRQLGGFADHRWVTFDQAKALGGSVRKGEKSTIVIFWTWFDSKTETDKDGRPKKLPCLRYYRVFNVAQCDGLDAAKMKGEGTEYEPTAWESIEAAEGIAAGYLATSGVGLTHGGASAFYRPSEDRVNMPDRDRFESPAEYYAVLFHEMTHSTGHATRLDRLDAAKFGSDPYAREELIAEMGAAFLCGETGIEASTIENSAAYIDGWLKVLKSDRKLVATAAAQAQKAVDLILGRKTDDRAEKETETAAAE